jgi:hypothetical protein
MDHQAFRTAAERVEAFIKDVYGIGTITRDIPDPLTGDLNGTEIHIDHAVTSEERLFLLGHLFGHTVQWNTDPNAYDMGRPRQTPVEEALIPSLMDYEVIAGRYALQLFHDCDVRGLDQWLADYTAADRAYLAHFYRTGIREPFRTFRKTGTPLIDPLPIPAFALIPGAFRSDGIVV